MQRFLTVVLLSVGSMDKGGVDTVIATERLTENKYLTRGEYGVELEMADLDLN
jgi:hypothetical protein